MPATIPRTTNGRAMNLSSNPILACLSKEAISEIRSRQGVFLSLLFGLMAVVALSFATMFESPSPRLAAGLFAVLTIFVGGTSVPRVFLAESDLGTFDLIRQWNRSGEIFLGKAIFCAVFMAVMSIVLGALFVEMLHADLVRAGHFYLGALLLGIGAANLLALTSAMVINARNRWVLAVVVALPLLLPLVFFGIGSLSYAFGDGASKAAWQSIFGLLAYAAIPFGLGPVVADALWHERPRR